jgi:DNA-binding transcriptional ArsR family regulator
MEPVLAGIDNVLAAVADPSRRTIVQRLAQGPATTGQLAELLPMSRPAVSQHIRLLKEAGLIATTTIGRHSWHQLDTEPLELVAEWANRTAATGKLAPPLHRQETR